MVSIHTTTNAAGCHAPEPKYLVKLYFDDVRGTDGKHPGGTNIRAYCDKGMTIRDGPSGATCDDGRFVPELGRCQYHGNIKDLIEGKGYSKQEGHKPVLTPPYDLNNEWREGGTRARVTCLSADGNSVGLHIWKCKDGGWQPWDERYQGCSTM